jgi:2-polyprenyl-3-methyl-5-hydroxy-6-metoxy-1,4-benzoquinol methylase
MDSYAAEYHKHSRLSSQASARIIISLISDIFEPRSVIDVGCGMGEWLALFAQGGVEDILGVEHPGFNPTMLAVHNTAVVEHDLREPFTIGRTFDLAVSLEVAEHLPPERGEGLRGCCSASLEAQLPRTRYRRTSEKELCL